MSQLTREAKILLLGGNMWYFGEGLFAPFLAVFTERIGGSILDISGAWAIYLIMSGLLTVIIGRVSNTYSKEKMMIAGYVLNTLCTFGYIFVHNTQQLFILQAGLGVAAALASPTWDALYDKYSRRQEQGSAWGLADGTPNIVTGIAIIAGGIILNSSGSFAVLFAVMGCVQIIATVYQTRILYSR
jgi:MFS family permease